MIVLSSLNVSGSHFSKILAYFAVVMSTIAAFGIVNKTSPFEMLSTANAHLLVKSRMTLDVSIDSSESLD